MRDHTLKDAMDVVIKLAQANGRKAEQTFPYLHLFDDDMRVTLYGLAAPGSGKDYANIARVVIAQNNPVYAVMTMESWMAKIEKETTDPDLLHMLHEGVSISDLPRDKRIEALAVVGEARDGAYDTAIYEIVTKPNKKRHYVRAFDESDPPTEIRSQFRHLYIANKLLEDGLDPEMVDMATQEIARKIALAYAMTSQIIRGEDT